MERLPTLIEEVRREHAGDPRLAIFEVDFARENGVVILKGATSVPTAAEALRARVAALDLGLAIRDELVRLPPDQETFLAHAVVRSATAPILAGPVISESHLSQLVLGDRVLVLREYGRWLQCRATDGYIGWIHRGYLQRMSEVEARAWELGTDAQLHVSLQAELLTDEGSVLMRLPWGARVGVADGTAILPDGLRGSYRGDLVPLADLRTRFPTSGEAVVMSARLWMGAPYVWGGITHAGVDCSGLIQAVFRTHGREMPRDSDQQEREGIAVDYLANFENVRPGDLLFFAEKGNRISHVAISMGGSRIIHSSLGNAGVRTNDLLGKTPFEKELRSLVRSVRRVIPTE